MFKKNSMEFFVGLQSYLYYCYSGCTLKSHDHLLFPECSMVTWPCYVTLAYSVPILPFTPLYTWVFEMYGEPFSYSRFLQQIWLLGSLSSMLSNKKDLLTSSLRWSLLAPASISCILQALLVHVSGHLVNFHWPFHQLIFGLCLYKYKYPIIIFLFPKLVTKRCWVVLCNPIST